MPRDPSTRTGVRREVLLQGSGIPLLTEPLALSVLPVTVTTAPNGSEEK